MSTVKEEFEFCNNSGTHNITSENILCCADTGRVVAVFYNERDLRAATGLVKKVELIDGKAYQFDVEFVGTVCGVYYKNLDEFNGSEDNYQPEICANIQLLEVK